VKASKTWILIADGARARIFVNEGPGKGLKPAISKEFATENLPTREVIADRPGSNASGGAARHGYAPKVDWHQFEKQRFAASMAAILNKEAKRQAFERLVLVAPPEPLGGLRAKLDSATRGCVVKEIGKDLTNLTEHELPKRLEADGLVL
jgi:protein required for attachment to host cells